jgi:hypothetical protein
MLSPLAKAMVANGVTYPVFAQALKRVFLEAARAELEKADKRATDSALSLLSGVHRKDVRVMTEEDNASVVASVRACSLVSEVVTRWLTHPTYIGSNGQALTIPLRGDAPSFEHLSQSVSKDFHSRSVLDELVRLGLVRVGGESVALTDDVFVSSNDFVNRAYFFSRNVHDHIAAGAANLAEGEGDPPFLEYAVFADGLSAASTHQLHVRARQLWLRAFRQIVSEASALEEQDRAKPLEERSRRMRFGVFFYEEPVAATNKDVGNENA